MGLEQQLAAYRAQFALAAPAGRQALYEAKIEELRTRFALDEATRVGDQVADFALPDAQGRQVMLSERLQSGPVVVAFYRGGWCPYCNIQLRAYQAALPEITALGARLIAISPQLPDRSLSTMQANELSFDVLSDVGNNVARSLGLVYSLPEELRSAMRSADKALPAINGDETWELPLPATYVIGQDSRVALAFVDVDYRKRLDPENIVAELRTLQGKTS